MTPDLINGPLIGEVVHQYDGEWLVIGSFPDGSQEWVKIPLGQTHHSFGKSWNREDTERMVWKPRKR